MQFYLLNYNFIVESERVKIKKIIKTKRYIF